MTKSILLSALAGTFLIASTTSCLVKFKTIKEGEVGIKRRLGKIQEKTLDQGFRLYFMGTKIIKLDTKIKNIKITQDARTKDGVLLIPNVELMVKINPDKAAQILNTYEFKDNNGYQSWENNYENGPYQSLIHPVTKSAIAQVLGKVEAWETITIDREVFAERIKNKIKDDLAQKGFILENFVVTKISIDVAVRKTITQTAVLKQQLAKKEMEIKLAKMELEKQRVQNEINKEKTIANAEAAATGNKLENETLTPERLQKEKYEAIKEMGKNGKTRVRLKVEDF